MNKKSSQRSSTLDMAEKIETTVYTLNKTKADSVVNRIKQEMQKKQIDDERDFSKSSNYRFNL